MPFAMVPVPEEHVLDVMRHITRIVARASAAVWDEPAIAEVWHDADEPSRALLAHVAAASSAAAELDADQCALAIGASVREVAAIVNELNTFARDTYRPNLIMAPEASESVLDGTVTKKRMLRMEPEIARFVGHVAGTDATAAS